MNNDEMPREPPAFLLRRAHQLSTAIFTAELSDEDLTPIQYASLRAVADLAPADITKLSTVLAVDRATLGGVVDRLESKGLLSREPSSRDRRTKLLVISDEGRKLLKRVAPAAQRGHRRLVERLDPNESKMLCDLLLKMLEPDGKNTG